MAQRNPSGNDFMNVFPYGGSVYLRHEGREESCGEDELRSMM